MAKQMARFYLLFLLSLCGAVLSADLTDAEWAAMKASAVARPRVVANHDGCDATAWPASRGELTLENFYGYFLDNFVGNNVTTMSYCPYSVGLVLSVPSKVTERIEVSLNSNYINICRKVEEMTGKDVMRLAEDFARAHGLEFFGCIRVNDVHDMHFPTNFSNYKKAHPEYLVGSAEKRPPRGEWTAFDFARPEVRQLFVDVVTELMENYEVDGFELDFCRMTLFFKSVAWNQPVTQEEMDGMTDAIRRIRANAERIGRARRRPIVLLFHMIDSPEVCRLMGLDVERWMQEGLFDIYAGGNDRGNYNTANDLAATCARYGIQYYAAIVDPYGFPGLFCRSTDAAYDGLHAYQMAAGATGTYLFNMHYNKHELDHVANSLEQLKFRDKTYFVSHQHENNYGVQPDGYKQYNKVPELTPWREFYGAVRKDYVIQVGDDFSDPAIAALPPEERPAAILYLDVHGHVGDLKVFVNGQELSPGLPNGTIVPYEVPLSLLKVGPNTLTLDATEAEGTMGGHERLYDGDVSLLNLGRPWWAIYRSGAGTKLVEDGAYRMNDNLTTPNGLVNMLRTFSGLGGTPFRMDFDLKTFPGNAPETAALRFADGRSLEVIDFQPDAVVLKYAKARAPFNTADGFHRYSLEFRRGKLTVRADGQPLLTRVPLPMAAGDPSVLLLGHNYLIPADSNFESMVMGSLNGPGTGSSCWRKCDIYSDMMVKDAALHITFPPRLADTMRAALSRAPQWAVALDFSNGRLPSDPVLKSTYAAEALSPAAGGVLLDNEVGSNAYMGMYLERPDMIQCGKRFLMAEAQFTPKRAAKADASHPVFQMVVRPGATANTLLNGGVEATCDSVTCPWGTFPIGSLPVTLRIVVDMQEKQGALLLNGRLVGAGPLEERQEPPTLCWGDLSGSAGGAAVLNSIRFVTWD